MINSSTESTRLDTCIAYLYNKALADKNLFESISAIRKASGEVACVQAGQYWKSTYSDRVNRKMNEALTTMYCDPKCDPKNITHLKSLIETYREIHNMPEVELDVPRVQVVAPSLQDEIVDDEYEDEVDDCDVEDAILDQVQIGEYISYKELCNGMAENEKDKECLMDSLRSLVEQGYLEVRSRDPYNGRIELVMRVR